MMGSRNKTFTIILSIILGFSGAGFLPSGAFSSGAVGIEVDETVVSFDAYPLESQNVKLRVKNISPERSIIKISATDIAIEDDNKVSIIEGNDEANGLKNWVRINEDEMSLGSGESKEIYFSVNIPEEATVGSHRGELIIRSFPEISLENSQRTIVSGQLAVHIMTNVLGEVSGKGKISDLEARNIGSRNERIAVEYENLGNIHYIPHGEISSRNLITGREESKVLDKRFVFPGKKYVFSADQKINPYFGIYLARAEFVDGEGNTLSKNKFVFGRYLPGIVIILLAVFSIFLWRKKKGNNLT